MFYTCNWYEWRIHKVSVFKYSNIMWILFTLWTLRCTWIVRAESQLSCLRHRPPQCLGPYVIRAARNSSSGLVCGSNLWSVMTSCMQRCQKDRCCQAFGLDAAGECVNSMLPTEKLHFVKESNEPFLESCRDAMCAEKDCQNGGLCLHLVDDVSCVCPERFPGERCEHDLCASDPCLHGSTCLFVDGGQICQCISGFYGDKCERIGDRVFLSHGLLTVHLADGYNFGDWGNWDICSTGSYAAGIQLNIEPNMISVDNTAVNVIRLLCLQAWDGFPEVYTVTSSTM